MRSRRGVGALAALLMCAVVALSAVGCSDDEDTGGGRRSHSSDAAQGPDGAPVAPGEAPVGSDPANPAAPGGPLVFTDVTTAAGISFRHNSGAFGKKYLPETMGSGCAFLDYDNDGWQDVIFVNSSSWPEKKAGKTPLALYHNNQNGTFTDVTAQSGLGVDVYGLGVAVGDFDNDGNDDVYLTCLGANHLFKNLGGVKFQDVTAKAGVGDTGFSTSAAWFDYDRDGKLDLFVCNYVDWSLQNDVFCALDGKNKSYCTPEAYKGQSCTLYHNRGGGTFEDVTKRAGVFDPTDKSLGVALVDVNNDGWLDLFVANDTQPNRLYKNNGDGTFVDVAVESGVAYSDNGTPRAGMGVDAADFDGSGKMNLVVGNFTNEKIALYRNDGAGLFVDETDKTAIGKTSSQSVTFSCFFFDYDLDGNLDLLASNGHVADDISVVQPQLKYAQTPFLFRNVGGGKFDDVTGKAGAPFAQPIVGRGAAYGDFDNDGDLDVLLMSNNGPARLLRNDGGNRSHMLRVRTVGTASNHDGIGAIVTVKTASGAVLKRMVKSGSSYCSQSEMPVTFGLGAADTASSIEVAWPSGRVDTFPEMKAGQSLVVQEGVGITSVTPIGGA